MKEFKDKPLGSNLGVKSQKQACAAATASMDLKQAGKGVGIANVPGEFTGVDVCEH
jgi:hypothetical protein